ncbi:gamma-glutamylcyclotransferase family protein [Marinoscillum sp.]|uniref:gamma-glutamylcyclotransferase family protein n=1 Tax=Marinoscillum sp. TaxID=2024838 RepID=UPI003BAD8FA9
MSREISPYLFAYGFLKRKYHGSHKTQTPNFGHRFVSVGKIPGSIYKVDVFPGVIYEESSDEVVHGEVFELISPEVALKILDRYENAKPLVHLNPDYERRLRPVLTEQGIVECWVYEYLRPINPATKIHSGTF